MKLERESGYRQHMTIARDDLHAASAGTKSHLERVGKVVRILLDPTSRRTNEQAKGKRIVVTRTITKNH